MAWAVAVRLILAAILPSYLLLLLRPTVKVCVVILEQELSDRQTVDASATNQKDAEIKGVRENGTIQNFARVTLMY
jgi:hypothetical protein